MDRFGFLEWKHVRTGKCNLILSRVNRAICLTINVVVH